MLERQQHPRFLVFAPVILCSCHVTPAGEILNPSAPGDSHYIYYLLLAGYRLDMCRALSFSYFGNNKHEYLPQLQN